MKSGPCAGDCSLFLENSPKRQSLAFGCPLEPAFHQEGLLRSSSQFDYSLPQSRRNLAVGRQELLKRTSRSAFHSAPVPAQKPGSDNHVLRPGNSCPRDRPCRRAGWCPWGPAMLAGHCGSRSTTARRVPKSPCRRSRDCTKCTPACPGEVGDSDTFRATIVCPWGRLTAGYSVQAQTPQPASAGRRLRCFKLPEFRPCPRRSCTRD